ncbi:c-type cytochrome [Phenylobacterium sp.]|uniref:c-type cytochrome n=1 Tax=Phenylobacterium sp. TaxID=1871053 RepID=UPI002FD937E0
MSQPISSRSSLGEVLAGWPPPVLDPAGPYAGQIVVLAWALAIMFVVVFAVVLAAIAVALFGDPKLKARLGGERLVWIGGIAFPVVVLTGLLVWALILTASLTEPIRGDERRIRVTGEMWWWRVVYLDAEGRPVAQDANEIHIPVGEPVVFELTSADVIHSFWVPRLSGKLDMIPGRINLMRVQADAPGVYGGQCAEYCGGPHALMGLAVVAHEPADFQARLARLAEPAAPPAAPRAARGAEIFDAVGCGACHTIAGTEANGRAGPDLTHVGARRTLGGGILPNNHGALAGWISDSQTIKPGNRMPPYRQLSGAELTDLSAYMASLR